MHIYRRDIPDSVTKNKTVVSVGSFDGLHLGHRQIISKVLEISAAHNEVPMAVTFDPHPRSVLLGSEQNISMLYSFNERVDLVCRTGIDHIYVINFDESFRKLSPREYAEKIVLGKWNAGHIVAGVQSLVRKRPLR
jgi:riboflavin kinase/FMN adenylyltransferase